MKNCIALMLLVFISVGVSAQLNPKDISNNGGNDAVNIFYHIDSTIKVIQGNDYMPFDITTLDGRRLTNESCKGKVVFITFWHTGCTSCLSETQINHLNMLYDSLGNNPSFQFVSVTFNPSETAATAKNKYNMMYPVATTNNVDECYRLNYKTGFPAQLIIDKNGKVAYLGIGMIGNSDVPFAYSFQHLYAIIKGLL